MSGSNCLSSDINNAASEMMVVFSRYLDKVSWSKSSTKARPFLIKSTAFSYVLS